MPKSTGVRTHLFGVLLAVTLGASATRAADLPAAADAWVSVPGGKQPGAASHLRVRGDRRALLRFDLTLLPPGLTGDDIAHASVRLWVNKLHEPGVLELHAVTEAWDDTTLSAADWPTPAAEGATSCPVDVDDVAQWIVLDVTSIVRDWVDGVLPPHGLALLAEPDALNVRFASREAKNGARAPTLMVSLESAGLGPPGPTGAQGPPGPQGATGPKGDQGAPGDVGPAGPQGAQGDAGDAGAVGPQGVKGDTGDTGAVGPQGPQGLQGEQGDVGPAGPQGDQGEQGDVGPAGPQGVKGDTGDTGAVGPQGLQGEQGDVGPAGPQGEQGNQGDVGPQGLQGEQGDVGPAGPQGLQGEQGDVGPAGPQGVKGDTGDTGAVGPQGPQGEQGEQGEQGDVGPAGPQGVKGDTGDTGDTGAVGPQGPQGLQGEQGDVGPAGPQGVTGAMGAQGPAGVSAQLNLAAAGSDAGVDPPSDGSAIVFAKQLAADEPVRYVLVRGEDSGVAVEVLLGDCSAGTLTSLGTGVVGSAVDIGARFLGTTEYLLVRVDAVDAGDTVFGVQYLDVPPGYTHDFTDASGFSFAGGVGSVDWDVDATPGDVPGGAFNSAPSSLNFNDGVDYHVTLSAPSGSATLDTGVDITYAYRPKLTFACNYETETTLASGNDARFVRISNDDFSSVLLEARLGTASVVNADACAAMGTWHTHAVALDPEWGNVRVRFVFDAESSTSNFFAGWFVDDMAIESAGVVACSPPADARHGTAP